MEQVRFSHRRNGDPLRVYTYPVFNTRPKMTWPWILLERLYFKREMPDSYFNRKRGKLKVLTVYSPI